MPDGRPIGSKGSKPSIREIEGGPAGIRKLFDELAHGGTPGSKPHYRGGTQVNLRDGGWAGLRESADHGLTLDIDIPGIPFKKVHWK